MKENLFKLTETTPDPKYEQMGFNSNNIVENLTNIILALLGIMGLIVFVFLIRFIKNRFKM
jgi:hypothetical protein